MEDLLNEVLNYLIGKGLACVIEDGRIKIRNNISGKDVLLYCQLDKHFPYTLPKIYIDNESKKIFAPIPHLNTDNSVCVYDKSVVIPNFNRPLELIYDTIKDAIEVLRKGIDRENKDDFIDEFVAYWHSQTSIIAESFIDTMEVAKKIYWCTFRDKKIIIADSKVRLREINCALFNKEYEIREGLLIPILLEKFKKIPQKDVEIIEMVESASEYSKQYSDFLQHNIDNNVLVLFSIVGNDNNINFGWYHHGPGVPNGFRRGKVNLKYAYGFKKNLGEKILIENCYQTRLFKRGGDGFGTAWKKVCVIGCGSIGSFLIDALKYSGTEKFCLVDNEMVGYENIARHTAGYFGVTFPKTTILKYNLEQWNPNIVCDEYYEDAHDFLENNQDVINGCDILFVAVASATVEHHLNRIILDDKINVPVVLIWVEPFCIGGHAIVIRKKQNLYGTIFDDKDLSFVHTIVKDDHKYSQREAGCQSSYIPYSAFYIQQFLYSILNYMRADIIHQKGNYRLSWCGSISNAKIYDIEINDGYKGANDFTIICERID